MRKMGCGGDKVAAAQAGAGPEQHRTQWWEGQRRRRQQQQQEEEEFAELRGCCTSCNQRIHVAA